MSKRDQSGGEGCEITLSLTDTPTQGHCKVVQHHSQCIGKEGIIWSPHTNPSFRPSLFSWIFACASAQPFTVSSDEHNWKVHPMRISSLSAKERQHTNSPEGYAEFQVRHNHSAANFLAKPGTEYTPQWINMPTYKQQPCNKQTNRKLHTVILYVLRVSFSMTKVRFWRKTTKLLCWGMQLRGLFRRYLRVLGLSAPASSTTTTPTVLWNRL